MKKRLAPVPDWECPNHPGVFFIRSCVRCWRVFLDHADKIAALPRVGA